MSDGFNPYQPQNTSQATPLPSSQTPTIATVFGILNIIFGILGVCSGAAGFAGFAFISSGVLDERMKAEANLQQFDDPVFFALLMIQVILGLVLSGTLIAGGIGLLKFRPWGRKLSNFYAVSSLILLLVGLGINIVYTIIPALSAANDPGARPEEIGGAVGGIIGGVFGSCIGTIYPICLLIFMNRKQFVAQIEARA